MRVIMTGGSFRTFASVAVALSSYLFQNGIGVSSFVVPSTNTIAFHKALPTTKYGGLNEGRRKTLRMSSIASVDPTNLNNEESSPFFFARAITSADTQISTSSKRTTVVIAGATGYIGRAVVRESVKRGYHTVALVRNATRLETPDGREAYGSEFDGATVMQCDVEDAEALSNLCADLETNGNCNVDTIISCLASASGLKKEAYAIDYQATLNCLNAGRDARVNARHFVLLSAFCVRNPLLQLQQAKLKFEAELTAQKDLTYSIVRPTAFFKSVSGQLEGIQGGAPYVLFGDGAVTRCNPICERDLASFMMDSLTDESKKNKIMNIGGPDEPLTNQMLGEMMYKAIGTEPKFVYAPTWIFDYIINTLQFLANVFKSEKLEDAAETGRIGKYYAVEDMLTTDPSEKFGTTSMQDHYNKIASRGQDPFTPVRATAYISRVLEAGPALLLSLPLGYALSNPKAVENVVGVEGGIGLNFSMLLAALTNGNIVN